VSGEAGHLSDGQDFGRYRIVRMLGEGGMGAVYEAVHVGLKKRFAIKTLLPSISRNAEAQTRFLREGEAASRINHPNVVDVTDVGTQDGIPYLVMEFLEGETLADLMARQGPLDLARAVDILLPSIAAVQAGHDQNVIHRDLKPQNVFIARGIFAEGTPKILDFGVSKILGDANPALTGTMAVLGTAAYMSPEQARGARIVDAASDQYAIGLIFHEMLTGQRGHDGESPLEILHRIASGHVPDTRALRPNLPPEIYAILKRMFAMNPQERFPSLRDVARALLPFASEKVRITHADAFADQRTPPPTLPPGPRPAGSLPGSGGAKSGGTRLLPSTGGTRGAPPSMSGDSSIDLRTPARRKGLGPVALVVGVIAVGGAAVYFVVGRQTTSSTTTTATESSPSTPSSPTGPPPAAAAELPHVAPPPPTVPATPPPAAPEHIPVVARTPVHDSAPEPEAKPKHHDAGRHASGKHPKDEDHKPAQPQHSVRSTNGAPIID
jgi:serine/threonine-protein kinase